VAQQDYDDANAALRQAEATLAARTDVARPVVAYERVHHMRGDRFDPAIHALREFVSEIADQQRDVLSPLTERRNMYREDVETIIKITSELVLIN